MPSSPRRGERRLVAGLLILALSACRGPEEGSSAPEGAAADGSKQEGALVELERMLAGGEPVKGTQSEGEAPLAR